MGITFFSCCSRLDRTLHPLSIFIYFLCFLNFNFYLFIYFTLQYCIGFAVH